MDILSDIPWMQGIIGVIMWTVVYESIRRKFPGKDTMALGIAWFFTWLAQEVTVRLVAEYGQSAVELVKKSV